MFYKIKFGVREHKGELKESLKTIKYISKITFIEILNKYNFYCYDHRCNQLLFSIKNINSSMPFWLFIEIQKNID